MRSGTAWWVIAPLVIAGCGEEPRSAMKATASAPADRVASRSGALAKSPLPVGVAERSNFEPPASDKPGGMAGMMASAAGEAPRAENAPPKTVARKIIYNADIDLTTDDFDRALRGVERLVKQE